VTVSRTDSFNVTVTVVDLNTTTSFQNLSTTTIVLPGTSDKEISTSSASTTTSTESINTTTTIACSCVVDPKLVNTLNNVSRLIDVSQMLNKNYQVLDGFMKLITNFEALTKIISSESLGSLNDINKILSLFSYVQNLSSSYNGFLQQIGTLNQEFMSQELKENVRRLQALIRA
jgi:hypothetical protein